MLGQLGVRAPEILTADVSDPAGLQAMASRARVVLDLVGPYTRYGRPVIDACVASGAHYADLTGELPFVRGIIDAHHERASRAGLKLVQVCGFEALPADLLVAELAELAASDSGDGLRSVDLEVELTPPPGRPHASDMVSGGTFQSMATLTGEENAALALDPAVLIPDEAAAASVRVRSPIGLAPRRGGDGAVIAPMAPAPYINPGVIHRSALLRAEARSETFEPFRYREGIAHLRPPADAARTVVCRGGDRRHDGGPERARAIRTGGAPAGRGDDVAVRAGLGVRPDRLATGALALAHDAPAG